MKSQDLITLLFAGTLLLLFLAFGLWLNARGWKSSYELREKHLDSSHAREDRLAGLCDRKDEEIARLQGIIAAAPPAPGVTLALQGGQEPPGSTGAGETDGCPICGEPWKDHDFGIPHPVCPKAPLPGKSWYDKISPAPVVGGAGGESPAEPEENAGAGESGWPCDDLVYCKTCHKTHGVRKGEKECDPGAWVSEG